MLLAVLALLAPSHAYEGYLRQPDVSGDRLVFTAEGDLWTAPVAGGTAKRVTSHEGDERSAKFSPDGRSIAFTGEYDGNTDVFVMPADGGEPVRLTWHPGPDDAVGWTPDGKSVIFRSRRIDPNGSWHVFTVPATGGEPVEVPIGWASRLDVDPASGKYAFTRMGSEGYTWKRYRGGTADDIWVGDPKKQDYTKVTSFDGPDSWPMWHDGRVYFLSDEGGTANLWSMTADGADRKRHTDVKGGYDARWPSMGADGKIAFVLGADVHVFDPGTGTESKVAIDLPGERSLARVRYTDAASHLEWFSLAPDADRVLTVSRGEIFSTPAKPGVTIGVSRGSGARERFASYSPDGKKVVYVTDASGEEAIAVADAWGRGEPKVVKAPGTRGWHFPPQWSPDGKKIAFADETHTLYVMPSDGSAPPKAVDKAEQEEIREYAWSPDGRWLAYTKRDRRDMGGIYVHDTTTGAVNRVGSPNVSLSSPAWDPDGRYLYFLSAGWTNPIFGSRDFSAIIAPQQQVMAVLLRPDVPNPFADNAGLPPAPESPQAAAEKKKKDKKKKDKKDEEKLLEPTEKPLPAVTIDWNLIDDRVLSFPIPARNYVAIAATPSKVMVLEYAWQGMNEPEGQSGATVWSFDFESRKADVWASGVQALDVVGKAHQAAVLQGGAIYVVSTNGPATLDEDHRVRLEDAVIELDPREEWRQIYLEAWRSERDFFWEADLGGVDWNAVRDRYLALLPRVSTRWELQDLIGETIGELGTSHTYVWGGDPGQRPKYTANGLLGADLAREGNAVKITRILRADAADNVASPLLEPGAGIKEGEYITAVDHRPIPSDQPLEALLAGRAGKRTLLTVSSSADGKGGRDVAITPAYDDSALRYADWVRRNREYVTEKTGGKVGYIHVPDMSRDGLVAFETWLYPQADKEALVVDVRWNGGGFVSQLLLEKLRRPILGWDYSRGGGVYPYPYARRQGPFVVLTNAFAGSDGDIFPKAVQVEGLAPVVGERSWGGVVGIRGDKPLVDGGLVTQPEYAFYFTTGGWDVENRGVVPDVEVGWSPQDVAAGKDTQLDAAIGQLDTLRAQTPPLLPPAKTPGPRKSREDYQKRETQK
jgi:tricorn protease